MRAKSLRAVDAFIAFMRPAPRPKDVQIYLRARWNVSPRTESRQGPYALEGISGRDVGLLPLNILQDYPRPTDARDDLHFAAQRLDILTQRRRQVISAGFDA